MGIKRPARAAPAETPQIPLSTDCCRSSGFGPESWSRSGVKKSFRGSPFGHLKSPCPYRRYCVP